MIPVVTMPKRPGIARLLTAGVVACVCVWAVAAFWAAPVGDAVAARVAADDRGAVYSPGLDPLIHGGVRLTGSGESGEGEFGHSVALSSDGKTALIGGEGGSTGAAWVFTRSRSTWTQQGAKLTGGRNSRSTRFGDAVALSGNGTTALIGAGGEDAEQGAAWVFESEP
jgi:hypothetical protein